jgi:hypothetical protein
MARQVLLILVLGLALCSGTMACGGKGSEVQCCTVKAICATCQCTSAQKQIGDSSDEEACRLLLDVQKDGISCAEMPFDKAVAGCS